MDQRRGFGVVGVGHGSGGRRRRAFALMAAGLLVLIVALLCGAAAPAPAAAGTGHITGTVTGGGGALEGIYVTAYGSDDWDWVTNAYTDASGAYDLDGLDAGSYRVRFHDGAGEYLDEWYNDKLDIFAAADVPVTDGQTTSGIDAALAAPGHITGTVTGGGGALEDVVVTAYQSDGWGSWDDVDETSTAADGTYDLDGLHTGSYRVEFHDWSGEYLGEYYNDKPTPRRRRRRPGHRRPDDVRHRRRACRRRPHHRHGDGRRRCARGRLRGGVPVRRLRRLGIGLRRLHGRQRRLRPRWAEHRQLPRRVP